MLPSPLSRRKIAALLAALAALLSAVAALLDPSPTPPAAPAPTAGLRVAVLAGPGHTNVVLDTAAQKALRAPTAPAETVLHDTAPPTHAQLHAGNQHAPHGQPRIPHQVPLASVYTPGCTTALVRNYSSRNGARPVLGFIHWTGSWAPGPAIVRWFDTPAAQASSNYITDQDGHCWLTVAESQKAWTQAAANPWALSVEIVNNGTQPLFLRPAARAAVLRLMVGWHHRWGIPYRHGAVNSSCVPTRSGFLAHRDGGACAGGHPDVGSFDLDGLIAEAARLDNPAPPVAVRVACRKLTWHRHKAAAARTRHASWWTRSHVARAHSLKDAIAHAGWVCPAHGPIRHA